jgi:hypothetical protein
MVDDDIPNDHGIHNILAMSDDVSQTHDGSIFRDGSFDFFFVNTDPAIQNLSDDFHFTFDSALKQWSGFEVVEGFSAQKSLISRIEMRRSSIRFCGSCGIDAPFCFV